MLKDLEAVYTVYQEKSFSKAAAILFVSQPALSATIKKIERQIQMPLFDRSKTPIQLTVAGEYYIKYVENMLQMQRDMETHFANIHQEHNGVLNIGSAAYFCTYILPDIIEGFKIKYPNYTVNLIEANAKDLTEYLSSNIIDISLDVDNMDNNLYNSIEWAEEHIILAVPADYAVNDFLRLFALSFDDVRAGFYKTKDFPGLCLKPFKDEQFLLLRQGNDLHRRSLKMLKNAGFTPKVFMYLDQMLTSYYIAKNGKGITFIRANMLDYVEHTDQLCFYKIKDRSALRNIMLNYPKNRELAQPAREFIEYLLENRPN